MPIVKRHYFWCSPDRFLALTKIKIHTHVCQWLLFFTWQNDGNVAANFLQFVLATEQAISGKELLKKPASHFLIKNGNKARHNKKTETRRKAIFLQGTSINEVKFLGMQQQNLMVSNILIITGVVQAQSQLSVQMLKILRTRPFNVGHLG